jgi:ankyrin repeat protein
VWWAAESGKLEALMLLLSVGGDACQADCQQRTPLHVAARYSFSPCVVEALIRQGACVDAVDQSGATPLHEISTGLNPSRGSMDMFGEIAEILIKAGANMRVSDKLGRNPIALASSGGFDMFPVVVTYIKNGALVEEVAPHLRYPNVLAYGLKTKESSWLAQNSQWSEWGDKTLRDYLVSNTKATICGKTQLQFISGAERLNAVDIEAAEILMRAGADMRMRDADGKTPIALAAAHGHVPLLAIYIAHGASVKEVVSNDVSVKVLHALAAYLEDHRDLLNKFPEWDAWVHRTFSES